MGYSVTDTSMVGGGFPDAVIAKNGEVKLVEFKTPTGTLRDSQISFIIKWNAAVYILRTEDDCVAMDMGLLEGYTPTQKEIKRVAI